MIKNYPTLLNTFCKHSVQDVSEFIGVYFHVLARNAAEARLEGLLLFLFLLWRRRNFLDKNRRGYPNQYHTEQFITEWILHVQKKLLQMAVLYSINFTTVSLYWHVCKYKTHRNTINEWIHFYEIREKKLSYKSIFYL